MLRRIVRHAEFQSFVKAADTCRVPHFFVPVLKDGEECFAYGITITARLGNAVKRNLLKRRIKAWFWIHRTSLPKDVKINLIARTGACDLGWAQVSAELDQLIHLL